MKWKEYPAGADITLFEDAFTIYLVKNESKRTWMAYTYISYGIRVISEGKKREKVKEKAEEWVIKHCQELLVGK